MPACASHVQKILGLNGAMWQIFSNLALYVYYFWSNFFAKCIYNRGEALKNMLECKLLNFSYFYNQTNILSLRSECDFFAYYP